MVNKLWDRIGIREKIMGIVILIVFLLGSWTVVQVRSATRTALSDYLQRHGVSIAQNVSTRSENYLLTNDRYRLHQLLSETMENNTDIQYIFIKDINQQVEMSSFSGEVPEELISVNTVSEYQEQNIQPLNTDRGLIYDIAVPIFDGRIGTVRLGMNTDSISQLLYQVSSSIWLAVGIISIIGLIIAYLLSLVIINPIYKLVYATEQVAKGHLQNFPLSVTNDEIGKLSKSFQHMIDSLKALRHSNDACQIQLEKKEEMRRKLLNKMMSAQEEERKKISRELHDSTGQSLTTLKLALKQIGETDDIDKAHAMSEELRELTGDILEEIKGLARDLRPSVLDDLGLEYALEKYLKEIQSRTNISTDFWFEVADKNILDQNGSLSLTPETSSNIYRIVQESVNNSIKHGSPDKIDVIVKSTQGQLIIIIEDDGEGFETEMVNNQDADSEITDSGLGIFGMAERAELISGQLDIESKPGEGTAVYLKINLIERGSERP